MDIYSSLTWARRHYRRFKKSCRRMQGFSTSTLLGLICLVLCILVANCVAAPATLANPETLDSLDLNSHKDQQQHLLQHHQNSTNYPNRFDEKKEETQFGDSHAIVGGRLASFPAGRDEPDSSRWPSGSWKPPGWDFGRPPSITTKTTTRRTTSSTSTTTRAPSVTSRPSTMASIILPVLPEGDQGGSTDIPSNKIPTCDNLCKSGMGGLLCQCDILPIG